MMNGLSDDIIRGCFRNPREIALDEAREEAYRAGYVKALGDVIFELGQHAEYVPALVRVSGMKSDYEKGAGDGNQ